MLFRIIKITKCFINQISTGRTHSAAWTSPPLPRRSPGVSIPLRFGLPTHIPPQYGHLQGISMVAIQARLKLLYRFSDILYACWRLLPLCPQVRPISKLTSFDLKAFSFLTFNSQSLSHFMLDYWTS
jgi:hypothetical protein